MKNTQELTINEAEYNLPMGGKGKIAVFMYSGDSDPKTILDNAVSNYVEGNGYHELIDYNLDNPWMRVVLSDINKMKQEIFDVNKHKLNNSH
jgi:hypothetical protein